MRLDVEPLHICEWCLQAVLVVTVHAYSLYLYVTQLLRLTTFRFDQFDVIVLALSTLCILIDLATLLIAAQAISSLAFILKLLWALALYALMLRLLWRAEPARRAFSVTLILIVIVWIVSAWEWNVLPVRTTLLTVYLGVGICSAHQIYWIRRVLGQKREERGLERELLSRREYQSKVLSPQLRYHLQLRRAFCLSLSCCLAVSSLFILDLPAYAESLGVVTVVFLVQEMPLLGYYFFLCADKSPH